MSPTLLRPALRLGALLLTCLCIHPGAAARQAATPPVLDRGTLYAAQGEYQLQDGRALSLRVGARSVAVRIDDQPEQRWQPESPAVLISPDGRQRLHLHRDASGRVDQVSLESPRGTQGAR